MKNIFVAFFIAFLVCAANAQMKFDATGQFRVMHVTDIHDIAPCNPDIMRLLAINLEKYAPDLVIISGDIIDTSALNKVDRNDAEAMVRATLKEYIDILVAAKTCFAVTFGNHEHELAVKGIMSEDELYDAMKLLGGEWFVDYDVKGVTGCGNGAIGLYTGDELKVNLVLMDSGLLANPNSYDGPRSDQIGWYVKNGAEVPNLWFQHIIVSDVYHNGMLVAGKKGEKGTCCSDSVGAVKLCESATGGLKGVPHAPKDWVNEDSEHTYCGATLYQTWVKTGKMKGAFFGHDHFNDFDYTDGNGIRLVATKALTIRAYNDGCPGFRIIDVKSDGTYDTCSITFPLSCNKKQ